MRLQRWQVLQAAFTLFLAAGPIFALTVAITEHYGPKVEAAVDCQRYAEQAEKELLSKPMGTSWYEVSNGRAQAWAMLYIGCKFGAR